MYIINPTENDLKEWYSCNKRLADKLIKQFHLSSIYCKGDIYYFRRTRELSDALEKLSWFDLMKDRLNL